MEEFVVDEPKGFLNVKDLVLDELKDLILDEF